MGMTNLDDIDDSKIGSIDAMCIDSQVPRLLNPKSPKTWRPSYHFCLEAVASVIYLSTVMAHVPQWATRTLVDELVQDLVVHTGTTCFPANPPAA